MLQERCRFTLNVVEDKLYAVGGCSENFDDHAAANDDSCRCERYDPATDTWCYIAPLPRSSGRTQHAGAAYKHLLFVSGTLPIKEKYVQRATGPILNLMKFHLFVSQVGWNKR